MPATRMRMTDRRIRRNWALDLTLAGKQPLLAARPLRAERQHVVLFEGREGRDERFSFWLTLPNDDDDPQTPPTRKQYEAVSEFYGEGPATWMQAEYLMAAWYYADEIRSVRNFGFTAPRRRLIHVATAAFILSQPELRRKVRGWSALRWRDPGRAVRIQRTRPYEPAMLFAADLIADMQGAGADIFGSPEATQDDRVPSRP